MRRVLWFENTTVLRCGKLAVAIGLSTLLSGAAQVDAASALTRLLTDYRDAEARLRPSASMPLTDRRYLDRYDDDLTAAYIEDRRKINSDVRTRLSAIDRTTLKNQDRLSYDIFDWSLKDDETELKPGIADRFQLLPINHFNGAQITFAREAQQSGSYGRARDYDTSIRRMLGFSRWIDQAIANMREGIRQNVTQPRSIVERMIGQIDAIAGGDPESSVFMKPVKTLSDKIPEAEQTRIADAYRAAVLDELIPAYRRLSAFLKTEYLPHARQGAGLAGVPGGKEMYLYLVKSETTSELSPDEIHALGLREVARIETAMEAVKKEAGFSGSLEAFRQFLRTDARFKFKDEAAMRAEFVRVRDVVLQHLNTAFSTAPKAQLNFRFHEGFVAPDRPAAEYVPGSGDGRRPGVVYLNSYDLPSRPTYTSEVLELHEGVPGHHLQTQLAAQNSALPRFRRFGQETAFVEGWGLYAESLGPEFGLYSDPYQKFGALSFDAWRASRLVVDTGMHWLGWSREQAIVFLASHTTLSRNEAEEEVDRYIAIPAQALAYKIGERDILDLRERAKASLGDKFDLKRFHDAILRDGAMPLSILNAKVDRWIAAVQQDTL